MAQHYLLLAIRSIATPTTGLLWDKKDRSFTENRKLNFIDNFIGKFCGRGGLISYHVFLLRQRKINGGGEE